MSFMLRVSLVFVLSLYTGFSKAHEGQTFKPWLTKFARQASEQGISERTIQQAFHNVEYDERIIEMDRKQPEFTQSFQGYLNKRITALQIKRGKRRMQRHRALFDKVERHYGVDAHFIAAIWGVETNFGSYPPRFDAIQTLATLAYDPRRSDYFKNELLSALRILDKGWLEPRLMKGSYSGAMGQPQFMPSTYLSLAQDFDHDGMADIWDNNADVLASIAVYLKKRGAWAFQQPWGFSVQLPKAIDLSALNEQQKPLKDWLELGVIVKGDKEPLELDKMTTLIVPERANNKAFLVFANFNAIMTYNPTHFYALAVCLLADKLKV